MCWRAEVAAGLSTRLDQFGVSHTSPRGYLPFSEVQRGDKMKEPSHLTKGKRKKAMGSKPTKQDGGSHAVFTNSLTHSLAPFTHFFIYWQQMQRYVYKALCEVLQRNKDEHET